MDGFLLALPYIGFINFVLFGKIDFRILVTFTTPAPKLLFNAGDIKIAPLNRFGFYKVK